MKISHLPHDLESEILSRVPTKSLAKFRTTCKRWYALFRDPNFIKKNFGTAPRKLMLLSNFGVYSVSIDHNGIHNNVDPSIEFFGKLSSLKDSEDLKISKIFHCEGLILCTTKGNTRLVIWDSSTSETRQIKPRTRYRYEDYYALGYVNSKSSGHSFKILRSCCYVNDQKQMVAEFEIYEFSSDSWRVLDYFTRDYGVFCSGRSLKGNTYWVAGDKENGLFMLYFDFTTERFGRFPLPFESFNPEDTASLSVVREEKLSVLHQKILDFSNEMKIWLTNKIGETIELSWSNFVLTVDYDKFNLPSVVNVTSFLLDEENKVAVCSDIDMDDEDRTRVYVVGEDIYKQVYKDTTKASYFNWPLLINYVPSLVHIKKNTLKRQKKRKSRENAQYNDKILDMRMCLHFLRQKQAYQRIRGALGILDLYHIPEVTMWED